MSTTESLFYVFMVVTAKIGNGGEKEVHAANDLGWIRTWVGCGKASAFIHGAPTLSIWN